VSVKLSDWVFRSIADLGVKHVFMVTGGGAMHLNDSLGQCAGIQYVCTLHEQAAAMAAESYAKVNGDLGRIEAHTTPTARALALASLNVQSLGRFGTSTQAAGGLEGRSGVRQMGVRSGHRLDRGADHEVRGDGHGAGGYPLSPGEGGAPARTGRPGPVWLDLPLDVQGAAIDETSLRGFDPNQDAPSGPVSAEQIAVAVHRTIELLNAAERPVVLIGNGVRLGGARTEMRCLIERLGLPVLRHGRLTHGAGRPSPEVGRPGPWQRGANFTLQNSDWCWRSARLDLVAPATRRASSRGARKSW
jgi:acetolactate synthase-1/2/3 large subunit